MTLRSLCRADLGPLLEMWNRSNGFDPLGDKLATEKIWDDPDFDPAMALVADQSGQFCGFAMAVARMTKPGQPGFIKLMAVTPEQQRNGTGSRLLKRLESELSARDVKTIRIGESAPNYLVPGIDTRYAGAMAFFEKHGYQRSGQTCNLRVDLEAEDYSGDAMHPDLARQGITIRRALEADRDALSQFLGSHWPSWQDEVNCSLEPMQIALHLALRGNEILGFAAFDGNNRGTGWFGPMGTVESARGLGIGRVLLRQCLADIQAQGLLTAIIPWVGPVSFYQRHANAKPDREFLRYEKISGNAPGATKASS